jgi:hypothetical protein
LLAKEAAESRARLQSLGGGPNGGEKASRVGRGDIRRRQLGDIAAILGGRPSKRKRTENPRRQDVNGRRVNTSSEDEEPEVKADNGRGRIRRTENQEDRRSKHRRRNGDDEKNVEEDVGDHKSHRRRHRSRSEDPDRDDRKRRRRGTSGDRAKDKESRRRHRSRSRDRGSKKSRRRSESPKPESSQRSDKVSKPAPKTDYDSDPLDDIIGPRPPPVHEVRSRGRGTTSHASGIDSRFSATYDPTADVQLDPDEENDWDQALEALRDRQKWKQSGADRLRAAGFTEKEITKWEKGGEKREEDVRWAKQGEGREWDRGKVMGLDGVVTPKANWGLDGSTSDGDNILANESSFGRLKGT